MNNCYAVLGILLIMYLLFAIATSEESESCSHRPIPKPYGTDMLNKIFIPIAILFIILIFIFYVLPALK